MAKFRFRLLVGQHKTQGTFREINGGGAISNNDGTLYVAKNPRIPYTMEPGYKGDIIDTDLNLSAMFDRPGNPPKFQDISRGEAGTVDTEESLLQEIRDREEKLAKIRNGTNGFGGATLESMTVEELRKMAAGEEIDLGKAKTKEEIIKAINSAMAVA